MEMFCKICKKVYSNKFCYKTHYNTIHLQLKKYKCDYQNCDQTFSSKYRLNIHQLTHKGIKLFKCDICNKEFSEKGILKTHYSVHSHNKTYKCQYCPKTFKTASPLYSHIKIIHFNDKKFKCPICSRCFGKKHVLRDHLATHSKRLNLHKQSQSQVKKQTKIIIKEISFCILAY